MTGPSVCPRCRAPLDPPSLSATDFRCPRHGAVLPLQAHVSLRSEALHAVAASSAVPVWLPWPLPSAWLVTGLLRVGDERSGIRATAMACSGPAPLGGPGDLVLVAEEPGIGLGAALARVDGTDPATTLAGHRADARLAASGRPTALWTVEGPDDRAAFVGEAEGLWLWAILWPADAGHLLAEELELIDLRSDGAGFDLPCGAPSPRLDHPGEG